MKFNEITQEPVSLPRRTDPDLETRLRKLLIELMLNSSPPTPISPFDERLFEMARAFGFKTVPGPEFGLDWKNKMLLIKVDAPPIERVLSVAHELGHAQRMAAGHLDFDIFWRWHQRQPLPADALRHVITEEIMAWKLGMRVLRQMGCRFSDPRGVRRFREMCLSTYRSATRQWSFAVRRLRMEG